MLIIRMIIIIIIIIIIIVIIKIIPITKPRLPCYMFKRPEDGS